MARPGWARMLCLLATGVLSLPAQGQSATAYYIANEGVMVTRGETKILFDPLFRNTYNQYRLVPEAMETAMFAGSAPFDGVDAVFISHFHGDHFSAPDILRLLQAQPGIHLYAPMQAVIALRSEAGSAETAVFERVTPVSLAYQDPPITLAMPGLAIEVVRIPHSGWPTGRLDVENLAWRVTLEAETTVLHMGDADPNDVHFARDAEYWRKTPPQMAFPPDWFLTSESGQRILQEHIRPQRSVGVHVTAAVPGDPLLRPTSLREIDLFTRPGETRRIPARN